MSVRPRRALFALAMVGLFAIELRTIDLADVRFRARATFRSHDLTRDRRDGTDFIFDRRYALFLEDVAAATAPDSNIDLCVPSNNEMYDYAAAYVLAPRRVARARDGSILAGYECPVALPPGTPLRFGVLVRR